MLEIKTDKREKQSGKKEKKIFIIWSRRTGFNGRGFGRGILGIKSSRGTGRSQIDEKVGLKLGILQLCQSSHWIPGRKYNGLLLHYFQDIGCKELLVYHYLVHVLGKPVVRHDEVTYRDREGWHQSVISVQIDFFFFFLTKMMIVKIVTAGFREG